MRKSLALICCTVLIFSKGNAQMKNIGVKPCDSLARNSLSIFSDFYIDTLPFTIYYGFDSESLIFKECLTDTLVLLNSLMSFRYLGYTETKLGISTRPLDKQSFEKHILRQKVTERSPSFFFTFEKKKLPFEVIRLFYIYALYENNFQFKDSICLRSKSTGRILEFNWNNAEYIEKHQHDKTVKEYENSMKKMFKNYNLINKAQKSYILWQKYLNELGLQELRKRGWHPLYWSNLSW